MKAMPKLLVLLALFNMAAANGAPPLYEKYSVAAIHAHLYRQAKGEIDPTDLLDGKPHILWNVIFWSRATWILVDLTGPTFAQAGGKLTVKAIVGEKTLLDQTVPLDIWFNEGIHIVVPFLVYDTGCGTLEITATLHDLPDSKVSVATLKKSVPFECGE